MNLGSKTNKARPRLDLNFNSMTMPNLSQFNILHIPFKKVRNFAFIGGAGAFIGSLLGYPIGGRIISSAPFQAVLLRTGIWGGLIGLGIGLGLSFAQNIDLKRQKTFDKNLGLTSGLCAVAGFIGGIILVLTRYLLGQSILILCLAWGLEGLLMGGLIAPVIPNLPRKSAFIAGGIAGFLGSTLMLFLNGVGFSGDLSIAFADALKGIFLGLMLTIAEPLAREAWIVIHWPTNETSTLSLGPQPILIGSSHRAHIYLQKSKGFPPITARLYLEGDTIIMDYDHAMQERGMKILRHQLSNGDKRKLGGILLEIHQISTPKINPSKQ
jgi:Ca-activated chloride channel family protein